jgi:hypothetical protein
MDHYDNRGINLEPQRGLPDLPECLVFSLAHCSILEKHRLRRLHTVRSGLRAKH